MKKIFKKLDEYISIILLASLVFVSFVQILCRFVFNLPLDWSEELARYVLIMLVYLSASITIREKKTLRVEIIDLIVKGKAKQILDLVIQLISGAFIMYIAYQTIFLSTSASKVNQVSPAMAIPMSLLYGLESFLFLLMGIMFGFVFIKDLILLMKGKKEVTK